MNMTRLATYALGSLLLCWRGAGSSLTLDVWPCRLRLDGALLTHNGLAALEEGSRRFGTAVRVCQSFVQSRERDGLEHRSAKKKTSKGARQFITIGQFSP